MSADRLVCDVGYLGRFLSSVILPPVFVRSSVCRARMGGRGVQAFLWAMNWNVKREKKCGETDDFHVLTACLYCKRVSYSATTKAPRPMLSRTSVVRRGRWWIPFLCRWRRHRMRHGLLWDGLPVWPKHLHRLALEQTGLLRSRLRAFRVCEEDASSARWVCGETKLHRQSQRPKCEKADGSRRYACQNDE